MKDPEGEVRAAAASKLKAFTTALAPADQRTSIIMKILLPIIRDMVAETNIQVKTALAGVIMALAPLLGKENTIESLLPMFLVQLKDENPDVSASLLTFFQLYKICLIIVLIPQSDLQLVYFKCCWQPDDCTPIPREIWLPSPILTWKSQLVINSKVVAMIGIKA